MTIAYQPIPMSTIRPCVSEQEAYDSWARVTHFLITRATMHKRGDPRAYTVESYTIYDRCSEMNVGDTRSCDNKRIQPHGLGVSLSRLFARGTCCI
jgi:hypothetical protein